MSFNEKILSIQIENIDFDNMTEQEKLSYQIGHRNACREAAGIATEADELIEKLGDALENAKGAFDTPIARRRLGDDEYIDETRTEMNQALALLKRYREALEHE